MQGTGLRSPLSPYQLKRAKSSCQKNEQQYDLDVAPREEWNAREGELAAIFLDYMKRVEARATAAAK